MIRVREGSTKRWEAGSEEGQFLVSLFFIGCLDDGEDILVGLMAK